MEEQLNRSDNTALSILQSTIENQLPNEENIKKRSKADRVKSIINNLWRY